MSGPGVATVMSLCLLAQGAESCMGRRLEDLRSHDSHIAPTNGSTNGLRCGYTINVNRRSYGREAIRGEFPWQVAIIYTDERGNETVSCGGSLIHPRFVMTAAHCIYPEILLKRKMEMKEVRMGLVNVNNVDKDARSYVPDRIIWHSDFKAGNIKGIINDNDIALLRLPEAAPYTDYIRLLCLPSPHQNGIVARVPNDMMVAGWGDTEFKLPSDTLRFARVPYMDSSKCSTITYLKIPERQICAGGEYTDSCKGDSGGPLVRAKVDNDRGVYFEVIGIISVGAALCATKGVPAIHTRVSFYVEWIEEVIKAELQKSH